MSGFQHDLAGGNGNLVVTSIQSPNFVHGVSGWQISKDGAAEFHDIIIPAGSGGASIYFSSTAPASPNTGDLWYNTAAGLEVSQWNGSSWQPYLIGTGAISNAAITTPLIAAGAVGTSQIANSAITNALLAASAVGTSNIASGAITSTQISSAAAILGSQLSSSAGITGGQVAAGTITASNITAGTIVGSLIAANAITTGLIAAGAVTATQIAANTITASQLAAGIVYAGIVNSTTVNAATFTGSTFEGTDFIINTSGAFFYSGTPASGNLSIAIAPASGSDGFGNAYSAGLTIEGTAQLINFSTSGSYINANVNGVIGIDSGTTGLTGGKDALLRLEGGGSATNPNIAVTSVVASACDLFVSGTVKAYISGTTVETWHTMGAFGTGFSHGSPVPAYKLYPDGTVALTGQVSVASGTTSGTIVTLPTSTYFPLSTKTFAVPISAGTPATSGSVHLNIGTVGNIVLVSGPTAAAYIISLDGIRYPLDY